MRLAARIASRPSTWSVSGPPMRRADFGVVGDLFTIVPQLLRGGQVNVQRLGYRVRGQLQFADPLEYLGPCGACRKMAQLQQQSQLVVMAADGHDERLQVVSLA